MCKAHSIRWEHHITKIVYLKKGGVGEEGHSGGIYRSYCFWLVSSIFDPQDGIMAYYSSNESLMKCVSI